MSCVSLTSVHISDIASWCNIDFEDIYSNPLENAGSLYLNGNEIRDLVIPEGVTCIKAYAFYNFERMLSVTIPNTVTFIEVCAFEECHGLTSVIIPNSVTDIENHAFAYCSDLTAVTIPNSVTGIGHGTFRSCNSLTSIELPNSVMSIEDAAFQGCTVLNKVVIGRGVEHIGHDAFANCPALLNVYCYAENVPETETDAFDDSNIESATLHVLETSIADYAVSEPWSNFGEITALTEQEVGVDNLKAESGNTKTEIYDLSGRRVQKAQKGICIQNGKIVVKR